MKRSCSSIKHQKATKFGYPVFLERSLMNTLLKVRKYCFVYNIFNYESGELNTQFRGIYTKTIIPSGRWIVQAEYSPRRCAARWITLRSSPSLQWINVKYHAQFQYPKIVYYFLCTWVMVPGLLYIPMWFTMHTTTNYNKILFRDFQKHLPATARKLKTYITDGKKVNPYFLIKKRTNTLYELLPERKHRTLAT